MKTIELKAKSRKGKNIISRFGSFWHIIVESEGVVCLNGRPGFSIRSADIKPDSARWIDQMNDPDFEIISCCS